MGRYNRPSMKIARFLLFAALGVASLPAFATDFYAAPDGKTSNRGTKDSPWSLAKALANINPVKPGDTVWLRGGTYTGHFVSELHGTPDQPIVVRPYPGERASIDGNENAGNNPTLLIRGSYTWYRDFEVTNSSTERMGTTAAPPPNRAEGFDLLGPGTKAINLVIHDCGSGILTTSSVQDTEVYGNVIFYNGYDAPDRGHGHGIYVQNAGPLTRSIADNILFAQYDINMHAYTQTGTLDNLDFEGNTTFGAGVLAHSGPALEWVVGANGTAAASVADSAKVARNTTLRNNYVYSPVTAVNLGYSKGIASPTIVDNFIVGKPAIAFVNVFQPVTMTGNSLYGSLAGLQAADFSTNTYYIAPPTGAKVFVRPNKYEPGRANITIFNWDKAATVSVDLAGAVPTGTRFVLRSVHNYFGPPVLTGTYDGTPLQVPMTNLTAAAPVGAPAPTSIGPEFQAFVLLPVPPPPALRGEVVPPQGAPRSPVAARRPVAASSSGAAESARAVAVRYFPIAAATAEGAPTLELSNPGAAPARVSVRVLERDRDNTAAPSRDVVLAPRDIVRIRDPLATLGADVSEGMLEVRTEGLAAVTLRAHEGDAAAASSPARLVPWIAREQLSRSRELVGVRGQDGADAEIVLLNPNPESASIALTLVGGGVTLGRTVRPVPPNGFTTASLAELFPEPEIPRDEPFTVAVDAGGLVVYAAVQGRTAALPASPR